MFNSIFKEKAEVKIFSKDFNEHQKGYAYDTWSHTCGNSIKAIRGAVMAVVPTGIMLKPRMQDNVYHEKETIQIYWHQIQKVEDDK